MFKLIITIMVAICSSSIFAGKISFHLPETDIYLKEGIGRPKLKEVNALVKVDCHRKVFGSIGNFTLNESRSRGASTEDCKVIGDLPVIKRVSDSHFKILESNFYYKALTEHVISLEIIVENKIVAQMWSETFKKRTHVDLSESIRNYDNLTFYVNDIRNKKPVFEIETNLNILGNNIELSFFDTNNPRLEFSQVHIFPKLFTDEEILNFIGDNKFKDIPWDLHHWDVERTLEYPQSKASLRKENGKVLARPSKVHSEYSSYSVYTRQKQVVTRKKPVAIGYYYHSQYELPNFDKYWTTPGMYVVDLVDGGDVPKGTLLSLEFNKDYDYKPAGYAHD